MLTGHAFRARTITLLLVALSLAATVYYLNLPQPKRRQIHIIPTLPNTTCVLELGVQIHTTDAGWISGPQKLISSESISLHTQDGEPIWGARNLHSIVSDGIIHSNQTGLEHDIRFRSGFEAETPKLSCNGRYDRVGFEGTSREGSRITNYADSASTYSCVADFTCRRRSTDCRIHPELANCPETGGLKKDYKHGECLLYLTEHLSMEDGKLTFDVSVNDPTGMNLVTSIVKLAPSSNITLQKHLEHPLVMRTGQSHNSNIEFIYDDDAFTKTGKQSNKACTVSEADKGVEKRESTCRFNC